MVMLSPARANVPHLRGLLFTGSGKVRDTYELPNGRLLQYATDGISCFDIVLNALIPGKGIILNAMNHFWLTYLERFGIKTHLIAAGSGIDNSLPPDLIENANLQSRAMIVRQLNMVDREFIARSVLTGSVIKEYAATQQVYGHQLPLGLQDGDSLPYLLDTPTTKAQEGHDEKLDAKEVREKYPLQTYILLQAFQIVSEYARQRGLKYADTKLEFGQDGILGDEAFTPDSSRIWDFKTWQEGRKIASGRKAPPPLDKQLARDWCIQQGINKLNPKDQGDVQRAWAMIMPEKLIRQLTQTYRYIFWRLTGQTIESYLWHEMRVHQVQMPQKTIAIVCGSNSDTGVVFDVISNMGVQPRVAVRVMSCHRNPAEVMDFARNGCMGADVVIAVGGKAFALPGVLDAQIYAAGKDIPVIGVALGSPGSQALQAALLSIAEVPGQPVVMDEASGSPYAGKEGLLAAINRVMHGELPPSKPRESKPVELEIFKNY